MLKTLSLFSLLLCLGQHADQNLFTTHGASLSCDITADAGEDILLCALEDVQLQGSYTGSVVDFYWTPSTGLNDSTILDPIASISGDMMYELVVLGTDPMAPNLVTNGDFESGNVGFTTDYTYVADDPNSQGELFPEGTYSVTGSILRVMGNTPVLRLYNFYHPASHPIPSDGLINKQVNV